MQDITNEEIKRAFQYVDISQMDKRLASNIAYRQAIEEIYRNINRLITAKYSSNNPEDLDYILKALQEKEQRQVSTDEQGTLTQAGEWQTTDDYIIRNDAPRNSVATRYVFKGTLSTVLENSPVVELPHVMLDNSELNVTTQDTLTDEQKVTLSQQAQNTIKSIYDDKFNSLQDYQESVQPNQPSFPSIQTTTSDERQQFLDKINQKITEMNQMLDNTNVNEQSNEGKTR